MPLHRLFRTSAFRLSLLQACLFSLLSSGGLGFLYWSTASYIQTQVDARLRLETDVLVNLYRDKAMPALAETVRQRSRAESGPRQIFFYRLLNLGGPPLPGARQWPPSLPVEGFATVPLADVFRVEGSGGDQPVRVMVTRLPGNFRLLVGRDLNEEQELLGHTLRVGLGVSVIILLLAAVGSVVVGFRNLRRVDAISMTAGEIMAGDLGQRIPLTRRNNEFDDLGHKLNAMLERIEQLLLGMRQVTDNVAHDLRSPLNRLRARLEVTLLEARDSSEYQEALSASINDVDGLLRTFNALLSIAQAEAGVRRDGWQSVDLAVLAEELVELYQPLAEEQGLDLRYHCQQPLAVRGNRQLLAQALGNLLDNAVKYTPAPGRIVLAVEQHEAQGCLTVTDTGPGIPAAERERVLERFVRLDSARSAPGNGLGLSLVRAVARLHGATLTLADNNPGLRVTLAFSVLPP